MEPVDAAENEAESVKCNVRAAMLGGHVISGNLALTDEYGLEEVEAEIADAFTQNSFIMLPVKAGKASSTMYINVQNLLSLDMVVS